MQKAKYINELGVSIQLGYTPPFILQTVSGTGNVMVNVNAISSPFQDGKQVKTDKLDMRNIVLNTTIKASNSKQLFEYRELISSIFNPKLKGVLEYETPNGTKKINAVIEQTPTFSEYKGDTVACLINILCPDPYWYDLDDYNYTFQTPITPAFSFPMNTMDNEFFQMGYESRTVMLDNKGHVATPLLLIFEGGVKNVVLENLTTGEFLKIDKRISSNNTLRINSGDNVKEVSLMKINGDKTKAWGMMTLDSSFLHLAIGENTLRYTAESDSGTAILHLNWKQKYLGV